MQFLNLEYGVTTYLDLHLFWKIAHWQELLSEFNFMLEHRPRSNNHNNNALSHWANLATSSMAVLLKSKVATNTRGMQALLEKDPTTQYLVNLIKQGKNRQSWLEMRPPLHSWRWRFEENFNHKMPRHALVDILERNVLVHCDNVHTIGRKCEMTL